MVIFLDFLLSGLNEDDEEKWGISWLTWLELGDVAEGVPRGTIYHHVTCQVANLMATSDFPHQKLYGILSLESKKSKVIKKIKIKVGIQHKIWAYFIQNKIWAYFNSFSKFSLYWHPIWGFNYHNQWEFSCSYIKTFSWSPHKDC